MNMLRTSSMLAVIALSVLMSACSDRGGNGNNATVDLEPIEPETSVLLTKLVDDMFQQSADSDAVEIQSLAIVDNADEFSFDYLIQGE